LGNIPGLPGGRIQRGLGVLFGAAGRLSLALVSATQIFMAGSTGLLAKNFEVYECWGSAARVMLVLIK
jgi:hypothetical protein